MKLVKQWVGVVYVLISTALSVVYVLMIRDSMANDLFWPNMTPNGAHTYLLDVISRHLLISNQKELDMFDPSSALINDYNSVQSTHTLWPSYPRLIVYTELTTIQDAIVGFRAFDSTSASNLHTQYCWVDLDRRWEMAHTSHRQARCYQRYQTNGAVYLEAVLRNVDWDSWCSRNYPNFMIGVGNYLLQSSDGRAWLANVQNAFESIDKEVAYWTTKGLTTFVMQWQNRYQTGISEAIAVINVFETSQPLTLYHIAQLARDASWTAFGLNWAFPNDLWLASTFNVSLVRNSTNFAGDTAVEWAYFVYPYTPASILIHDLLGPFGSIDAYFIAPPHQLVNITATFSSIMIQAFQTNTTLLHEYMLLPTLTLDPVPKTWHEFNYEYYGGSPLCTTRVARSFVQSSFLYDDVCGQPKPLQIATRPETAFFAYSQLRSSGIAPEVACPLCLTAQAQCLSMINQLESVYDGLMANTTILNILKNNVELVQNSVEIIQFATLNSTSILLRQNLLQDQWSFFGYVGLYEWVFGEREVISFEGDAGIFAVLSERLSGVAFTANQKDIPNYTSQYLWSTTIATTIVLIAVAIATIVIYIRQSPRSSYHLYFFNRIVGPVWLGRPLMLVRSATAIIILSTSPIVFDASEGMGRFHFEPRSFGYRLLLASEASWLTDVTIDVLLIFTQEIARVQAPLSSLLFWITIVCLESFSPIRATAIVERTCTRVNMDLDLTCTSGVVRIGSIHRALVIIIINVSCVIVATVIAKKYHYRHQISASNLLPASTLAFCSSKDNVWTMDVSIACMSGIFRYDSSGLRHILDTKLWIVFDESIPSTQVKAYKDMTLAIQSTSVYSRKGRLLLIAGLLYLIATVVGSISYIRLADVSFVNDFWWANFNSTGTLTFIANWYDRYRVFTPHNLDVKLDNLAFADTKDYSKANTVVTYSPLYASLVQHDIGNDIKIAIHGLRQTHGCLVPWIATQYCWLDFEQKYSMANSILRQKRCEKYQTNGAMYLEAPLRNVQWKEFESCWGGSFDIGIARHVYNTSWLQSIKHNTNSEDEEMIYWYSHNITTYTTQWQNYKTVGLIDTFSVVNAFGVSYPINLQNTNGAFRLDQESSMKMYWSFARDLMAVSLNSSRIAGMSLLRESSHYAYQNLTPQAVYLLNDTLTAPLSQNFALFSKVMGPFGTIDMYYVPVPQSLLQFTRQVLESLSVALATNLTSQIALKSMSISIFMQPVPKALQNGTISGGSLLCNQIPYPTRGQFGMQLFFSFAAACNIGLCEVLFPTAEQVLFGLIASQLTRDEIFVACSSETASPENCALTYQSALDFITLFMPTATQFTMREQVIRDVATVELMQYIVDNSTGIPTPQLFHQPVLDAADPSMLVFGWMYLFDWAMGVREVVNVQGDYSSLSVISTFISSTSFSVDAMEIPHNLSAYCRALSQYISFVLAVIASIAGLYSLLNHFTTEGYNLFETNRVGALVWIGRPLLFVRSLTALAILSTAPLELQVLGNMTFLATTRSGFIEVWTKVLAAAEVNWLVYIIQDIAMVFTKDITTMYVPISSIFTWIVSICLSLAAPVIHQASLHRQCAIESMNYQLVCSSGTLTIGSFERFLTLIVISFATTIGFYIFFRCRYSYSRSSECSSGLLSCGAKYLYDRSKWVYNGVYYIDYSSAALTGLIVVPSRSKLYVFDVKMWQILVLDRDSDITQPLHLQQALPLMK